MRTIETAIEIDAPPADVWAVLVDGQAYPDWNPFVRALEGDLRVGERIRVRLQPPGGRGMTFRPVVRAVDPPHELRWLGQLGLPRIFDGEHRFVLEPLDGGTRTRFVHGESFRGVLVPFVGSMLRDTTTGFAAFNEALRDRVTAMEACRD